MTVDRIASKPRRPHQQVDWTPYDYALPSVEQRLRSGDFPSPKVLADIIEFNKANIPSWLLKHICAELRGEVKRKRGRKRHNEWLRGILEEAHSDYRYELRLLQRQRKESKTLGNKPESEEVPHDRALEIVHERYGREYPEIHKMDLARFRNLLSSYRRIPSLYVLDSVEGSADKETPHPGTSENPTLRRR